MHWPISLFLRPQQDVDDDLETTKRLQDPKKNLRARDAWTTLRCDLNSWLGRGLPGIGVALQKLATSLLRQLDLLESKPGHVQSLGLVHILWTPSKVKVGSSSLCTSDEADYQAPRLRLKQYRVDVLDMEELLQQPVIVVTGSTQTRQGPGTGASLLGALSQASESHLHGALQAGTV